MQVRAEYQAKGGRKFFSIAGSDSPAPPPEILEKIADEIEQIKRTREYSPPSMGLITHANLVEKPTSNDHSVHKRSPKAAPPVERSLNYESAEVTQPMLGPGAGSEEQDGQRQPGMKKAIDKLLSAMSQTGLSRFDVHSVENNARDDDDRHAYKPADFPVELTADANKNGGDQISTEKTDTSSGFEGSTTTGAAGAARDGNVADTDVVEFETQNVRPPTTKSVSNDVKGPVGDEDGRRGSSDDQDDGEGDYCTM